MERWKIIASDGLEVAQCLFEAKGVRVTKLPAPSDVVKQIIPPLTFPTREQAEQLIELLKATTIPELKNAKAIRA